MRSPAIPLDLSACRSPQTLNNPPLVLEDVRLADELGELTVDALSPSPAQRQVVLSEESTPLCRALTAVALSDVEANLHSKDGQVYFGAGAAFGGHVYERDIAYSALLGLNTLYPTEVLSSLKLTRQLRLAMGFQASRGHVIREIPAPWNIAHEVEREHIRAWGTSSFTRRTDDVVWVWAAWDWLQRHGYPQQTLRWFHDTAVRCWEELYRYWQDPETGLYFGQASFIDIHHAEPGPGGRLKTTGYPQDWPLRQCVLIHATSTNVLHFQALRSMAESAKQLGYIDEATTWRRRAEALRAAILRHLRNEDGTFVYYRGGDGSGRTRREALGAALAVLSGLVEGDHARRALAGYPVTVRGVPIFHPFFDFPQAYHNHTTWPFVDAFFCQAWQRAFGHSTGSATLALTARTLINGPPTFREVVGFHDGVVDGSHHQLWTAAGFLGAGLRDGWLRPVDAGRLSA